MFILEQEISPKEYEFQPGTRLIILWLKFLNPKGEISPDNGTVTMDYFFSYFYQTYSFNPGPEVIKLFSGSTQLSMKFFHAHKC